MPKFRKKPVVVEAVQFEEDGSNWAEIHQFMGRQCPANVPTFYVIVNTVEGDIGARRGDWIIRGVKGEFYPCKPDIFAETYEPATPPPSITPGGGEQPRAEKSALTIKVSKGGESHPYDPWLKPPSELCKVLTATIKEIGLYHKSFDAYLYVRLEKALAALHPGHSGDGWIAVSERLPETNTEVRALMESGAIVSEQGQWIVRGGPEAIVLKWKP
jgi:hypothetical protein